MSCSAFSTERGRCASRGSSRQEPRETIRFRNRFERAIARVLVLAIIGSMPGSAFGSDEFPSADAAQMLTPGEIDQSLVGETTITSFVEDGQTLWSGGLDLPAGHTLNFDLVSDDSTHWNLVGGDFTAHINGTVVSGPNNTIVFASPFGVFIGSDAILDVGTLVAVGADVLNHDLSTQGPVLELTGAIENQGLIRANADVLLYGTSVRNAGDILAPNGEILLLGADAIHFFNAESIAESLINPIDFVAVMGAGSVENRGRIAAPNVALLSGRVVNYGEIEIADGSLMMIGADAVYVSRFDNPVLIRLPHAIGRESTDPENPDYRVENHGQIDAGLGHVRLAASDPLGWGIRQGTGSAGVRQAEASIAARRIEIEGGEEGRVHLSGRLDASGRGEGEVGGEIDVTGSLIALVDATIEASGDAGGGTIQIGGEQQGRGDLQRARSLVMNEASAVRADGLREGDGGRVILFSEDFTSIAGEISARGGEMGGDGGFIETSGLRIFQITQTPDASAPHGAGGHWLIDPYAINIVLDTTGPDCQGLGLSCLNRAMESILAPNFDDAAFDDILRTVAPQPGVPNPNDLSVDLLIRALVVGTNVTLSTEIFNPLEGSPDEGDGTPGGFGDITVAAPIEIRNDDTLLGTRASLTLLAAGSIYINEDITVRDAGDTTTPDLSLDIVLRANDQSQRDPTLEFNPDQLRGSVHINADIRTGGGDFTASGISVNQAASTSIETDGGDVEMISGSLNGSQTPGIITRSETAPEVPATSADPGIRIAGTIDTSRLADDPGEGGDIALLANAILVTTTPSADNLLQIDTGILELTGTLMSDGGDISLDGGTRQSRFAGSVDLMNGTIMSQGGNVSIDANRVDSVTDSVDFDIEFVDDTRGEGGSIASTGANVTTWGGTLSIGSISAQKISLDGMFSTIGGAGGEDGLMAILALDSAGVDDVKGRYGRGEITLGENGAATLLSAGIRISTRDLKTALNNDAVSITAMGTTTAAIPESSLGVDSDVNSFDDPSFATQGEVVIDGARQIVFNANTLIEGGTLDLSAAPNPDQRNGAETNGVDQPLPADPPDLTRLTFNGTGGANAAAGVRLHGDDIFISIGDGTTISAGLVFEATEEEMMPTDFGLLRGTRGEYDGLQLRDRGGSERPEVLSIRQDGDLTVDDGIDTLPTEIFFGGRSGSGTTTGAFAAARIGDQGQSITLESSDGVLTIVDAAGLSSDLAPSGIGDNGLSRVVLNGGFLLPPDEMSTDPTMDSVVFSGSFLGDSAFNVEGLTVSTPRNLTITSQMAGAIGSAADLVFQAGRNTGIDGAAKDGTLTVEDGVSLQASDPMAPVPRGRLALQAGASGFGDLVFAGTATLSANDLELRAGAGRETLNFDPADRSEILGIANAAIREAGGGDFVSTGTTALSFEFRQDAAIDALTHLPTFANFASPPITSFDGAGAVTPVSYGLRSDFGSIDLTTDATNGARFQAAALSLVGLQSGLPAILVNEDFSHIGPSVELGGVGDFFYTQILAEAFNPTATQNPSGDQARETVTLRAGMNGIGALFFEAGVVVTAPTINLVASDGTGNDTDAASQIFVAGASFDLSGAAPLERTFVFQEDADLQLIDLPTAAQFIGGLPNILALRSDSGLIDITGFDITTLPLDLSVQARLILEANSIQLVEGLGADLVLSTDVGGVLENLGLRLRTNSLRLGALFTGVDTGTGRVLAGSRTGDTDTPTPPDLINSLPDSAFSAESLLIEAFDGTTDIATTTNLSTVSEFDGDPTIYNLNTGRGPTAILIGQDGAVTPDELPNRFVISGYLERSLTDEADGTPIATTYEIDGRQDSITVAPDNVSGSNLILGDSSFPLLHDVIFESGTYDFASVSVNTGESIFVQDAVVMTSDDSIVLAAALVGSLPIDPYDLTNPMGKLVFEGDANTTLAANQIVLSAGPPVTVTNPDGTIGLPDGERDSILPLALAEIDFAGLAAISQTGALETSFLSVQQSRSLLIDPAMAPAGNLSSAIQAGSGEWDTLDLSSIQGELKIVQPELLDASIKNLILGRSRLDSSVFIETSVANLFSTSTGFNGAVRIDSNDVTFRATDGIELQLGSPNIRLIGDSFLTGFELLELLARLRSNPDSIERPIVRFDQSGDFSTTTLLRPDRYFRLSTDRFTGETVEVPRESLAQVDIELTTRGNDLIFGDSLRESASFSNLILRTNSGGQSVNASITFLLNGLTPGFTFDDFAANDLDATDFAALQLASLDVSSGGGLGTITVTPFEANGVPANFTVETNGDQRYSGRTLLQETLASSGRDIRFTDDIYREAGSSPRPDAGLIIQTTGQVIFEEDLGTSTDAGVPSDPNERLGKLWILFDTDSRNIKPTVQFGRREDTNDDGVAETPIDSDQRVLTQTDSVFLAANLFKPDDPDDPEDSNFLENLMASIEAATNLDEIASVLDVFEIGRIDPVPYATVGKSLGNLAFESSTSGGHFVMGSGERLSVGGTIDIDHAGSVVTLGDVAAIGDATAIGLNVVADEIGLVARNASTTIGPDGASSQDGGSSILANTFDFTNTVGGSVVPTVIGAGKTPRFGVPNPFDPTLPDFLNGFGVFAILPSGGPIDASFFSFVGTGIDDQVPSLFPIGASRSELTGAYGQIIAPGPSRGYREAPPLLDADRLIELAVFAQDTPQSVTLARLDGAAIIDDLVYEANDFLEPGTASVTEARLNAEDAELAIALYAELFGPGGERAGEVRDVLQEALDRYLETTRARRVIGFELRRFVKNRPSTLLEAYSTLDQLDTLFRYHRRLGLSPGEYKRIQARWLAAIQPDGITLDELSEAIHPSRYVRGSDILDIFGR